MILFDRFPSLRERVPWRPLGRFPTPLEPAPALGEGVFVKRDDLCMLDVFENMEPLADNFAIALQNRANHWVRAGEPHTLARQFQGARHIFDLLLVAHA